VELVSVSGYFQDLIKVGTYAKKSLVIAKRIDIPKLFMVTYRAIAIIEKKPQTKSKDCIFQKAYF